MHIDIDKELVHILKEEVKPALGCTEPVAIALAAAKAKSVLADTIDSCQIYVSPNIYKNGMGVGIPGTDRTGLVIAASMGITGGNAELGLNVLEELNTENLKSAEALADSGKVKVDIYDTTEKVYVEVNIKSRSNSVRVISRGRHDQIVYIEKNGDVLLDSNITAAGSTCSKEALVGLSIQQLIRTIEEMPYSDIEFLLDGISMNKRICEEGLKHKLGAGVGFSLNQAMKDGIVGDDLINRAVILTSAASDARMSGLKLPVMSSNGSGNHGLTAILPIVAYNDMYPQENEKLAKALAISHLVTAYIKNYTGRLSAVCGCGVAASTGSSAAVAWLMGLSYDQIEGAIINMIGNLSGMICDGAKAGCAYKLASAAGAAIQSAIAAKYDSIIPYKNGIIGSSVEESIRNLGVVSEKGMTSTDRVILQIMDSGCV